MPGSVRCARPTGPARIVFAALCAVFAVVPSARAATDPVAAVRACLGERDDARRLACFDAAAPQLPAGGTAGAAAATPAATAAAAAGTAAGGSGNAAAAPSLGSMTPEQRFGYSGQIAKESIARQKAETPELDKLTQKVVRVDRQATGDFVVTLENGQVWAQLATGTPVTLKAGETVTIKPASLGSYTLVGASGRGARVKRVR